MTEIDFRDAYCRWCVVPLVDGVKQPDELRVEPKTDVVRGQLRVSIGKTVGAAGKYNGQTRYKVEREVDGVFVLTSARKKIV